MSAYIVSKKTIDYIISAGLRHGYTVGQFSYYHNGTTYAAHLGQPSADRAGAVLWKENARSVNYRYNERGATSLEYIHSHQSTDAVIALKQIACLEYQSCERPDWHKSEAYAMLQAIKDQLIASLPGFDAAPWGM